MVPGVRGTKWERLKNLQGGGCGAGGGWGEGACVDRRGMALAPLGGVMSSLGSTRERGSPSFAMPHLQGRSGDGQGEGPDNQQIRRVR